MFPTILCSFTIAPSRAASYYSYSVVKGNVRGTDAATLYAVKAKVSRKVPSSHCRQPERNCRDAELTRTPDTQSFASRQSGSFPSCRNQAIPTTEHRHPSLKNRYRDDSCLVSMRRKPCRESLSVEVYAPASWLNQHPFMPATNLVSSLSPMERLTVLPLFRHP